MYKTEKATEKSVTAEDCNKESFGSSVARILTSPHSVLQ
jgi:hypothetical protein